MEGRSVIVNVVLSDFQSTPFQRTENYEFADDGGWTLRYSGSGFRNYVVQGEYAVAAESGAPTRVFEVAPDGGERFIDAGWGSLDAVAGQFILANHDDVLVWNPGQAPTSRPFAPRDAGIILSSFHQGPFDAPLAIGWNTRQQTQSEASWVVDWNQASAFDVGETIDAVDRWSNDSLIVAKRAPDAGVIFVGRICVP